MWSDGGPIYLTPVDFFKFWPQSPVVAGLSYLGSDVV